MQMLAHARQSASAEALFRSRNAIVNRQISEQSITREETSRGSASPASDNNAPHAAMHSRQRSITDRK
jgi:hypothetical protein